MASTGGIILAHIREDCLPLVLELKRRGFTLAGPELSRGEVRSLLGGVYLADGIDISDWLAASFDQACSVVSNTHEFIDEHKPVAALFWNTVQPTMAAAALACKVRGVPVFEVNHWRIATHLVGHFEDISLADHVLCSQEMVSFATLRNAPSLYHPTGQVAYDTWTPTDKAAARSALGLPTEGSYILWTSTWTHTYTSWSAPEWNLVHETAILAALLDLQAQFPALQIIKTLRGAMDEACQALGDHLAGMGLRNLFVTGNEGIKDLVNASDVVVTQKSGVAADCVVLGRPVVVFDMHPQADRWAYRDRGIVACSSELNLPRELAKLLTKPPRYIAKQQAANREWFGATGRASKDAADIIEGVINA